MVELCSMYVLLRGQVTVYHNYETVTGDGSVEDSGAEVASSDATNTDNDDLNLRQQLGAFVITFKGQQATLFFLTLTHTLAVRRSSIVSL